MECSCFGHFVLLSCICPSIFPEEGALYSLPLRAGACQSVAGCQEGKAGWSVPGSLVTLYHVQTGFGRGPQSPRWHLILSCPCLQQSHPDTGSTQLLCHLRGGHITPRGSTRKSWGFCHAWVTPEGGHLVLQYSVPGTVSTNIQHCQALYLAVPVLSL